MTTDTRSNNGYGNNGVEKWTMDWEVNGYQGPTVIIMFIQGVGKMGNLNDRDV
jgi:hypothetical protein